MNQTMKTAAAVLSFLMLTLCASAPTTAQQPQADPAQNQDPIRQLNLSPEQREQIRSIRQGLQTERVEANQKLKEANRALDQALESDNADESLIEQLVENVAQAQAAQMRVRVLTEVRIRRVLTPQQRALLKDLRQAARELRKTRTLDNQAGTPSDQRVAPNKRNAYGTFAPRSLNNTNKPRN